jgi:diguanylate cyclase (GGDEF)-like protein
LITKLNAFLYKHLSRQSIKSDREKYLFLISLVACFYTIFTHLFLVVFYFAIGVTPFLYLYLCGLSVDTLLLWLVKKRHYLQFGILFTVMVIVHTIVAAVLIGTNNYSIVYLLIALMIQIIIPYAGFHIRALMAFLLLCSMIALMMINNHMAPIWNIGQSNTVLALFNILLAFFSIITLLTIGSIIRGTIETYNRDKLDERNNEAHTDPLTGLLNRRYADIFFEQLSAGQIEHSWCIAMLDIDDFKLLNDTHGHLAGDGVLVFISDFIKASLYREDLVFRWGGEEFLLVLKDVHVETAYRILDKLRRELATKDIESHDKPLRVTVTIGVCPLDVQHIEQSIDACDRLMYKGKAGGKNMVVM